MRAGGEADLNREAAAPPAASTALNAICPYFTMFPLEFPLAILTAHARPGEWVLDPFCGRGTTTFASRLVGLPSIGIDSSPVAAAIARAKLATTNPAAILRAARRILEEVAVPEAMPDGEFWSLAYDPSVLQILCRLREGLLRDCRSDARRALRALLLGALHGPRPKHRASYLSNQAPRTYAPKPRYAADFWRRHGMRPEPVDVLALIEARARRFYTQLPPRTDGSVLHADSRDARTYSRLAGRVPVRWVITSPPYYGMRTYVPDQWLRSWLLGGPAQADYSAEGQIGHRSPELFAEQLRQVWRHAAACAVPDATLVVRFGGINCRKGDPLAIIADSLAHSGWQVAAIEPAGSASAGRRQAIHFSRSHAAPMTEHDVWAHRSP